MRVLFEGVYQRLLEVLTEELLQLQKGFTYNDELWHVAILGVKGDMPFLAKSGNLVRHWLRAARKDNAADPAGVCWLCMAGKAGVPFEDFNQNCLWSVTPATSPWCERPVLLRLWHPENAPEAFFKPDIWHNFHGGAGADFIASALTESLTHLLEGSKDARCAEVDGLLMDWVQNHDGKMPYSGHFSAERLALTSYQVQPSACWSKHADTRAYFRFLEHWLQSRAADCDGHPILSRIKSAVENANRAFSLLYHGELWLRGEDALCIGQLLRRFLRDAAHLAAASFAEQKLRFQLTVKLHMIDHAARRLLHLGESHPYVLNTLAESVQMDEDAVNARGF